MDKTAYINIMRSALDLCVELQNYCCCDYQNLACKVKDGLVDCDTCPNKNTCDAFIDLENQLCRLIDYTERLNKL